VRRLYLSEANKKSAVTLSRLARPINTLFATDLLSRLIAQALLSLRPHPLNMAHTLHTLPSIPDSISTDTLLILHTSTPTWPLSPSSAKASGSSPRPIHISVLDSSFNPPTLAHLAMASSSFPPALRAPTSHSTSSAPCIGSNDEQEDYTARLLLFSTTNVDKKPKPTDPSLHQRAEMMLLLSQRLSTSAELVPVAIGLLNQPTFAGKARVIHEYLQDRHKGEGLDISLTFLIGTDTLTRFFVEKYYTSFDGGMEGALGGLFENG